jgi:hypothetical protein
MADMNIDAVGMDRDRYGFYGMDQEDKIEVAQEEAPEHATGNVIRRYEEIAGKFAALLGRSADVRCDIKDNLLIRVGSAYQTQQDALQRKIWGGAFFQGLGGVGSFAAGALDDGPWKNICDIGSKLLPKMGEVVSATGDSAHLGGQKELQLANAAVTSLDTSSNLHQQVLQTYNTAMDRLRSIKDQARGG